jgi:hypothetical protein
MEAAVDSEKKKQEIEENLPKVDVLDLSDLWLIIMQACVYKLSKV